MKQKRSQIDFVKMLMYIVKRLWIVVLCGELGLWGFYLYTMNFLEDTYTASGTMYVNNESEYKSSDGGDLDSNTRLIKTYLVVVKSDKVMSVVAERLSENHPGITAEEVSKSLTMESVSDTGVVAVKSTTSKPQLSADIVNIVMELAPDEIVRVVGAGNVEIMDYAKVPVLPNERNALVRSLKYGFTGGAALAIALLAFIYSLNRKITDVQELKESYKYPVLASVKRLPGEGNDAERFLLTKDSSREVMESYAKLRMNLFYTLVEKKSKSVVVTSSISGEGKSTIAANLAIACAMSDKKVLLVDGDMRRATQVDIFKYDEDREGLSDILAGQCEWQSAILPDVRENVDLLPAGYLPPNPAELLESRRMGELLKSVEEVYDLVLLDMPPINIVADPLILSSQVAGCVFVTRQDYSDQRDIRKALEEAEMTEMNILGFVFYGENLHQGSYNSRRYYKNYYNKYYDSRRRRTKSVETSVRHRDKSGESGAENERGTGGAE